MLASKVAAEPVPTQCRELSTEFIFTIPTLKKIIINSASIISIGIKGIDPPTHTHPKHSLTLM